MSTLNPISFIGFGYGAGANVLSRFALNCPDMVEGLFLIHPSATASTWTELKTLDITRDDKHETIRCSVALICGQYSAQYVDESVKMNSRLCPSDSTWIKLSDVSMVLEEQPYKVAETFFGCFSNGLGYTLKAYRKKRALMMGMSMPCLARSRLSLYSGSADTGGPSTGGYSRGWAIQGPNVGKVKAMSNQQN
ncbi:protein NDRG1-like [Oppia nitens]|uniref:protein NDRG1-like n=1 Tax=Oppia nitens TaxID=1686743 RepID=UPI0023D9DBEB|nr:protein NDRG1-like [Oppia nitens]